MNSTIPELSDEQIESMRFTIMTDVGKASRAKTRRYRQVVVGAAAVIALGGIGATALASYDGTSSHPSASPVKTSMRDSGNDSKAYAPQTGALNGESAGDSAGSSSADQAAPSDESAAGREVITTGNVSMTVGTPAATAQKIIHYVEGAGGRVDARDETDASGDFGGSVSLTVRIPQTKVSSAIETFRSYGKVNAVSLADQDVTTQGQDLDARIKALQISVDRLESIMKDSKSTTELLKAETALSQRQADLDSLTAQRKGLTDQVKLSSLQIDISARDRAKNVSPTGFWGGIVDGWNGLVGTIDGAVHGLGVILPWGLALTVLGGLYWVIRRVTRRSSRV